MKKKSLRKKYKVKRKKSILRNNTFWSVVFFLCVLFFLFYFYAFYHFFDLENIEVSGAFEEEFVWSVVRGKMEDNIGLFSSQSIFFIPTEKIREDLLQSNLVFADISVKRVFPATLRIEEKKREPVAVWCTEETMKRCFYIDGEGIAYKQAEKKINFVFISSGFSKGDKIITRNDLGKLFKIVMRVIEMDVWTEFLLLSETGDIYLQTTEGWVIYFSPHDMEDQLDYLNIILEEKIGETRRKDLQYVDLRYGNRIFYK